MSVRPLSIVLAVAVGVSTLAGCSLQPLPTSAGAPAPSRGIATRVLTPTAAAASPHASATAAATLPEATAPVAPPALRPSPLPGEPSPAPHSPPPTEGPTPATQPPPTPGPDDGTALRASSMGPDGRFYRLLSNGSVSRLATDPPAVIDASAPLFDGRDPGVSFVAVDDGFLVLSSAALARTLVLERDSFARRGELARAGPVALDGARRLFVLADDAVWAYDLANLSAPPVAVTKWPVDEFTPRPRNLSVDSEGRQLVVTLHDVSASPPHQQEWYVSYDLDSLGQAAVFPSQLGTLTPASAGGGRIAGGMAALNGFLGSKIAIFDLQGHEVATAHPFEGRPLIDAQGDWVYVLGERGTWVLRAADLGLVAFDPYPGNAPDSLFLSPDGSKLYEVAGGQVSVRETQALRNAGIAPLHGFPTPWFDSTRTDFFRPRFYPAPGSADTAYVEVGGYGETWRTVDGGKIWQMLPAIVYPNFRYVTHLSISPDFAADRTLVASAMSTAAYLRSADAGDTWTAWEPPVAFVSDRDGNLEIYTADRGKLGDGPARNLVRRTNNPATDENPAWSPGWTRIAFQSNRNGNWDIFTMRADCDASAPDADAQCDVRQITNDPADDMLPAWSPDGRWIAFVSTRGGAAEIYLAPSNGGAAIRLMTGLGGAWRPAWLPDSQRFLYTAESEAKSNDILGSRVIEESSGLVTLGEVFPVISSPADERDATVGRDLFVYLSDETGQPRAYGRYTTYDQATSFPFTPGPGPEGHPALLDDSYNTVLVSLERNGKTAIYRANTSGYEPFVTGGSFDGQPAAGPVLWQPAVDWSQDQLPKWQKQP